MGNNGGLAQGLKLTLFLLVILNIFSGTISVGFQRELSESEPRITTEEYHLGESEADQKRNTERFPTNRPDIPKFYDGDINEPPKSEITENGDAQGRSSVDGDNDLRGDTNLNVIQKTDQNFPTANQSEINTAQLQEAEKNLTVTIVVLGRSGSGISSTIQELIGSKSECAKPAGNETLKTLSEYTVSGIPSTHDGFFYTLKLVDVPGFVDGRNMEQDSQILASLKSYIQSHGHPDFYIALSRFDDNRFVGEHSLFMQFLKRVELFQNVFLNNTNTDVSKNRIIFLLTRLMSETKITQRRPESKMADFKRTIQEFTSLQPPISIVVGDNHAESEYGAKVENGYYKLPNKQYYPKNIWQALINASSVETEASLLTSIMDNRENEMKCEAKLISFEWDYYDDDVNAFSYLLTLPNTKIEENEVNTKIQASFDKKSNIHTEEIVQKIALQLRLQQVNITAIDRIPTSLADQAEFFQKNLQFSATIPANLLNEAFQLQMPEYIHSLTVGYGYVVMADELSLKTPFATFSEPSSVGYQLPNFLKCRKLFMPEIEYFKSYSDDMFDYIEKRMEYLHFAGNENITREKFKGKVREGFNLQPPEGENVATLTAVEERRILTCSIVSDTSQWILDPEFIAEVGALVDFDAHKRETVTEWISWFDTWGSHIVTQGYGGGALHGSIVGANVKKVLESSSTINETLKAIVEYTSFPVNDLGVPTYRLYGGDSDSNSENLYTLAKEQRDDLLKKWEDTLSSGFKMLATEFLLEPISWVVKEKIGLEQGEMIDKAIQLLLKGELKYKRKPSRKVQNSGVRNQTSPNRSSDRYEIVDNRQVPSTTELPGIPTYSGTTLSSTFPSATEESATQTKFDDNNQMPSANVASGRENNEKRHQQNMEDFNRRKQEQQRLAEDRANDMLNSVRQTQQKRRTYLETLIDNMERSRKQEEKDLDRRINEMERQKDIDETRHQIWLAEINKRKSEEEARNECGVFKKFFGICKMRSSITKPKDSTQKRAKDSTKNCTNVSNEKCTNASAKNNTNFSTERPLNGKAKNSEIEDDYFYGE